MKDYIRKLALLAVIVSPLVWAGPVGTIQTDKVLGTGATGGFQGTGTGNFTGVYVNGVALTSGGTPGGSTSQVQYNSGGAFAGNAGLTYDGSKILTVGNNAAPTICIKPTGGTTNGSAWTYDANSSFFSIDPANDLCAANTATFLRLQRDAVSGVGGLSYKDDNGQEVDFIGSDILLQSAAGNAPALRISDPGISVGSSFVETGIGGSSGSPTQAGYILCIGATGNPNTSNGQTYTNGTTAAHCDVGSGEDNFLSITGNLPVQYGANGLLGFTMSNVDQGVFMVGATGGDKGNGTLNAKGLFVNNVAVSTAAAANPTATAGLTAVNGSATSFLRSDGAPAISQAIVPTWTGKHTFSATVGANFTTEVDLGGAAGSVGQFFTSNGAAAAPSWTGGVTGSFTATLTGCSVATTGTFNYIIIGGLVTISSAVTTCTANANTFTITGAPSVIFPTANRNLITQAEDNGNFIATRAIVSTTGTITLQAGIVSGAVLSYSAAGWTTTGARGVNSMVLTYPF